VGSVGQGQAGQLLTIKELLETGVHFGHRVRKWNPKMRPYIYTERKGIHIIDLEKTIKLFEEAYYFIRDSVAQGKEILFVGTKRQVQATIEEEAKRCGAHYARLPDIVFIVDTVAEANAVREANRLGIPIVAILDTNADPDPIDYPIPGNDDAIKATKLLVSRIADAVIEGREGRAAAAEVKAAAEAKAAEAEEAAVATATATSTATAVEAAVEAGAGAEAEAEAEAEAGTEAATTAEPSTDGADANANADADADGEGGGLKGEQEQGEGEGKEG